MKYLILTILLMLSATANAYEQIITLKQSEFEVVFEGFFEQKYSFERMEDDEIIHLTYWGSSPTAEIKYSGTSLLITSREQEIKRVILRLGNKTKSLSFNIQGKPAEYSESYINRHKGHVTVEIPPVYELNNIVLALLDKFHQTHYRIPSSGQYYQDVIKWFTPYKDHALFNAIKDVNYYNLVENGPAYEFSGEQIVPSKTYHGFRAKDAVKQYLLLLTDFAKTSHFKQFYQQHKAYYQSLINTFSQRSQPEKIWQWLENKFPERYQSYKVFFSPLGVGNHSARKFENNGLKETIMFISGPNRYDNKVDSTTIQSIKLSRTFFTEIDHAYVNPISETMVDEINSALPDLSFWYKGGGYNKPFLTFNEYMTWGVFSLYAMDTYSPENYRYIRDYIEDFMKNKKGFYRFKAFNNELVHRYKASGRTVQIPELYPAMLDWMARFSKAEKTDNDSL